MKEWICRELSTSTSGNENGVLMMEIELIRCKDCRYFETEHWEKVNDIPLIVAHEICTRWGGGCKTVGDGYCFMAERKEE